MAASAQHEFDEDGFDPPVERLLPRIDIEAFCVSGEFANSLQETANDRRMARTSIAVAMGGVSHAVTTYEDTNTPHLLLVETEHDGMAMFDELERLAEVCDPDTKVVVCGPSNDVTLYRELKRQGVDEYIVTPAAPIQVIEAISGVFADPEAAPLARTVGFIGVKGGVGASVLSHNLAWMLGQSEEKEVLLVDLDIQFGTAGFDFQHEPVRTVVDALGSMDELDDVKLQRLLIEHDDFLSILAAPASLEMAADVDETNVIDLIQLVRESTDFAVFDIPHIWTPWAQRSITQMEELVLVATPELASVRNLKSLYDVLMQRRPNDAPPRILLNAVGMPKRPEIDRADVEEVVGCPVDYVVPFDATLFGTAANDAKMIQQVTPGHDAVAELVNLCADMAQKRGTVRKTGAKASKRSLIDKLKSFDLGALKKKAAARKKNDTPEE